MARTSLKKLVAGLIACASMCKTTSSYIIPVNPYSFVDTNARDGDFYNYCSQDQPPAYGINDDTKYMPISLGGTKTVATVFLQNTAIDAENHTAMGYTYIMITNGGADYDDSTDILTDSYFTDILSWQSTLANDSGFFAPMESQGVYTYMEGDYIVLARRDDNRFN